MAIKATDIYRHHHELFDDEMVKYIAQHSMQEDLKTLTLCPTAEDSKKINDQPGPCLVMAGAGMCNAGRILHHLKANLWKPETHVIIVGYQGDGSLGRRLVNGEKDRQHLRRKNRGEGADPHARRFQRARRADGFAGVVQVIAPCKPRVVLTHGENEPRSILAKLIEQRYKLKPLLPDLNEAIEL